jgi:3-hydroxyisobutyrate dehydrogenase
MKRPRIAFLGLGIMGGNMARRLLGAGFPLTVYNRNAAKAAPFAATGARVAASPRDAAANADAVLCMVADDDASRAMWLGENGALAGARRGAVLAECSTLTVGWIGELAKEAAARGCELLDAPVTGSKTQSAAGELNFIVGGSGIALEKIRPALAAMSRSITHLGPTGSGALVKLINNFVCGVQVASLAEALALIECSGLDRAKAVAVITEGAPGSPLVKTMVARMTAPDYTPNFMLRLMAKDLAYALKEGAARGQPLASAAAALAVFQSAIAAGHGDQDMSAVVELLRKSRGAAISDTAPN